MSRSVSSVVWTIVAVLGGVLVVAAVVFGPNLYREGKAMVAPIAEMAKAEERFAALNTDFPYEPPADGVVSEQRLLKFLEIRRQLEPQYEAWAEAVREVERSGESWDGAKQIIGLTRDVINAQTDILRAHSMSVTEFRALEFEIYDDWLDRLDAEAIVLVDRRLRELTEQDLVFVAEVRRRHGGSPAVDEVETYLRQRMDALANPRHPLVPDVAEANSILFWTHREEIADLKFTEHELHRGLRDPEWSGVAIDIGDQPEQNRVHVHVGSGPEAEE